jgi:glycine cleavage system aminomethyltransferase T
MKPDDEKDLCGYVTSGQFSMSRGRGIGIGLCKLATLHDARQATIDNAVEDGILVLIRNINSADVYRPARAIVM